MWPLVTGTAQNVDEYGDILKVHVIVHIDICLKLKSVRSQNHDERCDVCKVDTCFDIWWCRIYFTRDWPSGVPTEVKFKNYLANQTIQKKRCRWLRCLHHQAPLWWCCRLRHNVSYFFNTIQKVFCRPRTKWRFRDRLAKPADTCACVTTNWCTGNRGPRGFWKQCLSPRKQEKEKGTFFSLRWVSCRLINRHEAGDEEDLLLDLCKRLECAERTGGGDRPNIMH